MYNVHANIMYTLDDKGQHSVELNYVDSDGIDVGAYAEGENIDKVVDDLVGQIEEELAERENQKAKAKEIANLENQIAELETQLNELKASRKLLDQTTPSDSVSVAAKDVDALYKKFYKDFESFWK